MTAPKRKFRAGLISCAVWENEAKVKDQTVSMLRATVERRYKDREASTGYYEEYEMRPRRQKPLVEIPGVRRGVFPYSPTAARVRIRTRLADSHQGIKFYQG